MTCSTKLGMDILPSKNEVVVPLGFEPKLTVSKTAVLPLHHGTVAGICVRTKRQFYESFLLNAQDRSRC